MFFTIDFSRSSGVKTAQQKEARDEERCVLDWGFFDQCSDGRSAGRRKNSSSPNSWHGSRNSCYLSKRLMMTEPTTQRKEGAR